MQALDYLLVDAGRRQSALAAAKRDEPTRLDQFAASIDALERQILALTPRVAQLALAQQQVLQELAVAELQRQKERLAAYDAQARFAVAQMYDRANLGRDGGTRESP